METVTDFIFLGSQITADGDCNHEIKRRLFLGRKSMTNLNSVLKSRGITLLTKVHIVKAVVFPLVAYGSDSWTAKKAEHQRTDAFNLWCSSALQTFESPLDCKEIQPVHPKGKQPWMFIGRTDAEADAQVLWVPDAESTHWKRPWSWERLKAKEEGGRGWDHHHQRWEHQRLNEHEFEQIPGDSGGQRSLVLQSIGLQSQTQLNTEQPQRTRSSARQPGGADPHKLSFPSGG